MRIQEQKEPLLVIISNDVSEKILYEFIKNILEKLRSNI